MVKVQGELGTSEQLLQFSFLVFIFNFFLLFFNNHYGGGDDDDGACQYEQHCFIA